MTSVSVSLTRFSSAFGLIAPHLTINDPLLASELFRLSFRNPVGLAAGLDKDGKASCAWQHLGFGFVEVGTVTPRPQPGNPKTRFVRFPADQALINRMGFNNAGSQSLKRHLQSHKGHISIPLGINLARNKNTPNDSAIEDYRETFTDLYDLGDYFVINVSSPNTPGLRDVQQAESIEALVAAVERARFLARQGRAAAKPVLVKVAVDLDSESLDLTVDVCVRAGVNGIIAINTTLSRDAVSSSTDAHESGRLSRTPLRHLALATVERIHRRYASNLPIIGVGGIIAPEHAYNLILAGASLIQVYTGLIYEGPGLVPRINRYIRDRLRGDGFRSLSEAIGAATR
jgi:dihydroorotate dehydrogenase